jgi:adenine-specific DNA-methyltransferase
VSRLTELIAQAKKKDAQLGDDLAKELKILSSRLAFGLNFERHTPETVELPGRPVRKGDKVRFLPDRGHPLDSVDCFLWLVVSIKKERGKRVAKLARSSGLGGEVEAEERAVEDLVVVAQIFEVMSGTFYAVIDSRMVSISAITHGVKAGI